MKYINVLGGSNSGKSTFSKKLAQKLDLAHIELDAINWLPGWQMDTDEVFRSKVVKELDANPAGWVVDGSYTGRLGGLVHDRADTVVFLAIPLYITLPRQFKRTFKRVVQKEKLWNDNQESFVNSLKLTYWIIKTSRSRKQKMRAMGPKLKQAGKEFLVFTSNKQAEEWLESLRRGK